VVSEKKIVTFSPIQVHGPPSGPRIPG